MSDDDDEEGVAEARNAPKQPDEEEEEDIFGVFFFINLKQKLTKADARRKMRTASRGSDSRRDRRTQDSREWTRCLGGATVTG